MKPYLFTATDRHGKRDSQGREAQSIEHLRAMLEREGYRDIEFLDSEFSAQLRQQRDPALQPNSARSLKREAELRTRGRSRGRAWRQALIGNAPYLVGALALAGYGLWSGRALAAGVGIVGFLAVFSVMFARLRDGDAHEALLRAQAVGDWPRVEKMIARLEKSPVTARNEQLALSLTFYKARLLARAGKLDAALALIEPMRTHPLCVKGMYHSRRGSLYYAAERIPQFVHAMQESYEASGRAQTQALELAWVNARFGDCARARELLDGMRRENLVAAQGRIFDLTEALCALRAGDLAQAAAKAQAALDAMAPDRDKAPHLALNGIVAGYAAIALARAGHKDAARKAFAPWRKIAAIGLDPGARRQLATLIPD